MIDLTVCQTFWGYFIPKSLMIAFIAHKSSSSSSSSWCAANMDIPDSLATSPYHSSLLAGLPGYIPYPHIAAVCMFELVVLLLLRHMRGVHRNTSLMSSSLLLQQCPACLVRLTCVAFLTGDRWPYSWCLVGCCRQDLFNIVRSILV